MRNIMSASLVAAAILVTGPALAVDGELDPGFVSEATFPGYGLYHSPYNMQQHLDYVGGVVPTYDQKTWVIGRLDAPGGARISVVRVERDGYPDTGFADQGFRTFVRPCDGNIRVADVIPDGAGGAYFTVSGCPDFKVYRIDANGELDPELAGTGILTIAFDQGGSNEDRPMHLAVTPDGGIVVAGSVATNALTQLGIAYYTIEGLPFPGFGTDGKLTLPFEWSVAALDGVNGAHALADGRIVVAGYMAGTGQDALSIKQFVVRLLPDGTGDPSFGNVAAGISKVDVRIPLGLSQSPRSLASWMDADGAVIQVGEMKSNVAASDKDVFLLRWRPDGQQDTNIGPQGVRQYPLDFAGPVPAVQNHNLDSATAITRQSDGKYVIATDSRSGDGYIGVGALRINPNFSVDNSFGNGGKIRHLIELSNNGQHALNAESVIMAGGRILVAALAHTGTNKRKQVLVGLQSDQLFADDLEWPNN